MSAALQGDSQEIVVMTRLYDAAVRQLVLKFEILNDEFKETRHHSPNGTLLPGERLLSENAIDARSLLCNSPKMVWGC